MAFVFLVPAEYLLAEVVVADLADELGLHAEPADGHARVRHGPAADDHALAHVDHLPGHEDIGHLVDLALDRERRDEVQAGMARRHDFQVPIGRHSQPLVKRVRARQARTTICARPATLSHPLRSKYVRLLPSERHRIRGSWSELPTRGLWRDARSDTQSGRAAGGAA